ncbi:MAG: hypothetical protein Q7S26_02495 [bacterium]|nr:hypothetical protein [bacterium]
MARVVLGESRFKARRRKRRILLASSVCTVLLVVVGGSIFLARAAFLRITMIVVSGASVVPPDAIQALVQQDIAGTYLFAYPKANILLYPKNNIKRQLFTQFPTLKDVDVHAINFHTLDVAVVERQPVALWCADASSSPCFLLDTDGLVYAPAPSYSGDAYKKYVGGASGALPWQYLTQEEFHALSALVDAVAKKESAETVTSITVDANNDVHLVFGSGPDASMGPGFTLLFALHDDTGKIFERFTLALTSTPFTVHQLADFEYLDLRFGDKLYYKLK